MSDPLDRFTVARARSKGWFVTIDGEAIVEAALTDDEHLLLWIAERLGIKLEQAHEPAPPGAVEATGSTVMRFPKFMQKNGK